MDKVLSRGMKGSNERGRVKIAAAARVATGRSIIATTEGYNHFVYSSCRSCNWGEGEGIYLHNIEVHDSKHELCISAIVGADGKGGDNE